MERGSGHEWDVIDVCLAKNLSGPSISQTVRSPPAHRLFLFSPSSSISLSYLLLVVVHDGKHESQQRGRVYITGWIEHIYRRELTWDVACYDQPSPVVVMHRALRGDSPRLCHHSGTSVDGGFYFLSSVFSSDLFSYFFVSP